MKFIETEPLEESLRRTLSKIQVKSKLCVESIETRLDVRGWLLYAVDDVRGRGSGNDYPEKIFLDDKKE